MHAWDEPAETLLAMAPQRGVQLLMPRLGEPVEPAHSDGVTPWWRGVDAAAGDAPRAEEPVLTMPKSMPWPLD
jgi:hypothetical protein